VTDSEYGHGTETLQGPTPAAARDVIARGIDSDAIVTVYGRCTVDYDGRATSYLEAGDRHVMLKPDGAALVHTDEGQQPVNWQPPGCDHDASCEDGTLVLESLRSTPDERLRVRFQEVLQVSAFSGSDENELALVGTEEDLRQRILEDPELLETGFTPLQRPSARRRPVRSTSTARIQRAGRSWSN